MRRTRSQQRIDKALHRLRERKQKDEIKAEVTKAEVTKAEVKQQWLKWPSRPIDIVRIIEFIGVIAAITVVGYDFLIEKPRDRAVRFATLANQIAQARSSGDEGQLRSAAVTVAALAKEGFALKNIDLSKMNFSGLDMTGGNFDGANMSEAIFIRTILSDASFDHTDLSKATMVGVIAENVKFSYSNFKSAVVVYSNFTNSQLESMDIVNGQFFANEITGSRFDYGIKYLAIPNHLIKQMQDQMKKAFCANSSELEIINTGDITELKNNIFSECPTGYETYKLYPETLEIRIKKLASSFSKQKKRWRFASGRLIREDRER